MAYFIAHFCGVSLYVFDIHIFKDAHEKGGYFRPINDDFKITQLWSVDKNQFVR